MSVIRWEEPPPAHAENKGVPKHLISHELIAAQLRRRPGEWAVIYESNTPTTAIAHVVKRAQVKAYRPAGSFEAVTRHVRGMNLAYARYIGEKS